MTDTEIEESVLKTVAEIWDEGKQWVPLTWTYCTECGLDSMKQRCIGDIVTGECLCVRHFALRRIEEKRRERDNEVKRMLALEEQKHKKLDDSLRRIRDMRRERNKEVRHRLVLDEEHKPSSSWTKPKFDVEDFARI